MFPQEGPKMGSIVFPQSGDGGSKVLRFEENPVQDYPAPPAGPTPEELLLDSLDISNNNNNNNRKSNGEVEVDNTPSPHSSPNITRNVASPTPATVPKVNNTTHSCVLQHSHPLFL